MLPPGGRHAPSAPPLVGLGTFTKIHVYGPDADWHVGVEILTLIPQVAEHLDQVENLH